MPPPDHLCPCHGEPMRRATHSWSGWRCAVKQRAYNRAQNAKRIRLGNTYLGTTNQYPIPREAVLAFAQSLRKEHTWPA